MTKTKFVLIGTVGQKQKKQFLSQCVAITVTKT